MLDERRDFCFRVTMQKQKRVSGLAGGVVRFVADLSITRPGWRQGRGA